MYKQPTVEIIEQLKMGKDRAIKDFSGYDFSGMDLSKLDLSGVNFNKANLQDAKLSYSNLHRANLYNANLRYANLYDACLAHANLMYADASGADLSYSILDHANLKQTNFIDAVMKGFDPDNCHINARGARYGTHIKINKYRPNTIIKNFNGAPAVVTYFDDTPFLFDYLKCIIAIIAIIIGIGIGFFGLFSEEPLVDCSDNTDYTTDCVDRRVGKLE
jgi:hypothetical protein